MQHHYRYYQKLVRVRKAQPLFLGSAIHSMIEQQIETGSWSKAHSEFSSEFGKLFREEQAEMGDLPKLTGDVVSGYLRYHADDGLIYPKRRHGKASEIKVRVALGNNIELIGFVDAFPQDSRGRNWVMDHKTHRSIPDEEARFSDLQLLIYVWALPEMGYPQPDGIIWDYLRTKPPAVPEVLKSGGLSLAKSIDTTPEVYLEAARTLLPEGTDLTPYLEFAEEHLKHRYEKFYRRVYLPNPPKDMVYSVVSDLKKSAIEIQQVGKESTVRNMTRDCKMCSYYSLCQAEVRGLDSDYIRKTEFTTKERSNGSKKEG